MSFKYVFIRKPTLFIRINTYTYILELYFYIFFIYSRNTIKYQSSFSLQSPFLPPIIFLPPITFSPTNHLFHLQSSFHLINPHPPFSTNHIPPFLTLFTYKYQPILNHFPHTNPHNTFKTLSSPLPSFKSSRAQEFDSVYISASKVSFHTLLLFFPYFVSILILKSPYR